MIGKARGQSQGALDPTMPETAIGQLEAQTVMGMVEVVCAANDIRHRFQGLNNASKGIASTAGPLWLGARSPLSAPDLTLGEIAFVRALDERAIGCRQFKTRMNADDRRLIYLCISVFIRVQGIRKTLCFDQSMG